MKQHGTSGAMMALSGRRGLGNERGAVEVVGVIGLGTMGGAMARHLLAAGYRVVGHDVDAGAAERCAAAGGTVVVSAAEVAASSDVVILSLPSVAAFDAVVRGPGGLTEAAMPRCRIVAETSTLPLEEKEAAHSELLGHGLELLDCPISGTGAQMAAGDAVFYASGDAEALEDVSPVLSACGRAVFGLGVFGNGTKLKLIANLLVATHNASAAEALVLARAGGIEPSEALQALVAGAGTSRMLELRGPMMVAQKYEPASMKVLLFMKDIAIIRAFARETGCELEVFEAAARLHQAALDAGWSEADPASVHAVVHHQPPT
ncbi:MAG: NAD(P)-dependent oxidoreductase [Actinomycetota bacterium]|nr:NAD(P)-dependent oxidoreductase [Actinomycetota bacterium]